ncbi:DUF3592 domain-containing protein [[Limnothrix rosea] IAM M-220]|uniref:DUF3592 domain-containing protein n=1 Tax=[Limnothrix rosea] IAM M-220 TaxID=454133 RepID=UPI000963BDE3|nr:DUF3592 domain-containing protein [[Limnothrix rosea] IAM M-220]OKH18755.1 hypothetical protein NIES208_04670 [[Limnothrix rosea] IAM M-220]
MQLSQHWLKLGIAGFLIIGGGGISIFGFGLIEEAIAAQNWPTTEGYIRSTKLVRETRGKRNIPTHHLSLSYGYIVDKTAYIGDRHSFGNGNIASQRFRNRSQAIATQNKYPINSKITVYYNPKNPSSAVLTPHLKLTTFMPVTLGLLLCSGGLRLLFSSLQNPI